MSVCDRMVARAKIRSSYAVEDPVDSNPSVSTKRRGSVSSDSQSQMPLVWVWRVCPTPNPVEQGTDVVEVILKRQVVV